MDSCGRLHKDICRQEEMLKKHRRASDARAARLKAEDKEHAKHAQGLQDLKEEVARRRAEFGKHCGEAQEE